MAFFKIVAEAISKDTFDYEEADGGWPDISWLIANHILSDYDEFSKHKLIDSMVGRIKQCLPHSIDYSEHDLNVKIYRGYTADGVGRKLAFITPDPAYKNSKDKDYERIMRGLGTKIVKAQGDVERRLPDYNERFIPEAGRYLRLPGDAKKHIQDEIPGLLEG